MATRIHNLSKWRFLKEGESLAFENPRQRTVVLDVNAPDEVRLYVTQKSEDVENDPERVTDREAGRLRPFSDGGEGTVAFIGIVKGRDRLEFAVEGSFELLAEGGGLYWYTADSQDISTEIVSPVIFTKIANRKERNPHLEMIEFQMRLNQDRMRAQLEAEMERRIDAALGEKERYAERRDTRDFVARSDKRSIEHSTGGRTDERTPEGASDAVSPSEDRGRPSGRPGQVTERGGEAEKA